jgi:hypothetical protein
VPYLRWNKQKASLSLMIWGWWQDRNDRDKVAITDMDPPVCVNRNQWKNVLNSRHFLVEFTDTVLSNANNIRNWRFSENQVTDYILNI